MRDIKFRGKRIDNQEWVYGYLVIEPHGNARIYYQPFDGCSTNTYHFVDPKTLGQFTGKKDAKGNEVYEGDYTIDLDWNDGSYYAIFYCDKNCAFRLYYYSYAITTNEGSGEEYTNKLDVVDILDFDDFLWIETSIDGNIHDNTSLKL